MCVCVCVCVCTCTVLGVCSCVCVGGGGGGGGVSPVKYLHVVSLVTRLWLNLTPAVKISCGVVQIIDSSSLALVLRIKA